MDDFNTVIYLKSLLGNMITLHVRYDNTIAEIKSLLKIKRLIANPVIIGEGGKICPDTYTVRDLEKINPVVIDRKPDPIIPDRRGVETRKPDPIIPECSGVETRKSEYRAFIVSALVLTTFAMYNLAHSISSQI